MLSSFFSSIMERLKIALAPRFDPLAMDQTIPETQLSLTNYLHHSPQTFPAFVPMINRAITKHT